MIDSSIVWKSWFNFKKGKKYTPKLHEFQYNLEENLHQLFSDLNNGVYKHGGYTKFIVSDNKRREISVCKIRDRIVHRLIYDYLYEIYNKTFTYDAWSCRKGKGLVAAIERAQKFLNSNPRSYIWKADVKKFFDNVNQNKLKQILKLRIKDTKTLNLLERIINSFYSKGMPIGNLTSQIFANIYLNELDRFIKHNLKPKAYLRYGDDIVLVDNNFTKLKQFKGKTADFLQTRLDLKLNPKSNFILKARHGLKFLGVVIYPNSRKLNKRNKNRLFKKLNIKNLSSYYGIVTKHASKKFQNQFLWITQNTNSTVPSKSFL